MEPSPQPASLGIEAKNCWLKLTMALAEAALPPASGDYIVRDSANRSLGLGLRVYASGVKSWIVQKKVSRRPVRIAIGGFPALNLQQAITQAKKTAGELANGLDPILEKRRRRLATEDEKNRTNLTIRSIFLAYETAKELGSSAHSIANRETARKRLEGGKLWAMPLLDLGGHDLYVEYQRLILLAKKGSNGGSTQASATMRWLRAAYNHAVSAKALVVANPFDKLKELQPGWYQVNRRTRTIASSENHLPAWWKAVQTLRNVAGKRVRASETVADYLTLSLLFGCRRSEILPLKWSEVSFDDRTVAFLDTKNGSDQLVPFGSYAHSILARRNAENQQCAAQSIYVFPASRPCKDGTYSHLQDPKKTLAKVAKEAKVPFSPHDLRRTFATLFEELDHVSTLTVEKVLNHAPTTTAGKHYVIQRMKRLRPLYQRFEDCILDEAEAGVPIASTSANNTRPLATIRICSEGGKFIATTNTVTGVLEAVGTTAKEARELLLSMV